MHAILGLFEMLHSKEMWGKSHSDLSKKESLFRRGQSIGNCLLHLNMSRMGRCRRSQYAFDVLQNVKWTTGFLVWVFTIFLSLKEGHDRAKATGSEGRKCKLISLNCHPMCMQSATASERDRSIRTSLSWSNQQSCGFD